MRLMGRFPLPADYATVVGVEDVLRRWSVVLPHLDKLEQVFAQLPDIEPHIKTLIDVYRRQIVEGW